LRSGGEHRPSTSFPHAPVFLTIDRLRIVLANTPRPIARSYALNPHQQEPTMGLLEELAVRCEAAIEPARGLDTEIAVAVHGGEIV
jgi:hypothetical protein